MTLLGLAAVSSAQDFQPSSEELKMTSEPLAPDAPAIILERRVDRNDNPPAYELNFVRIKVLNEEGRNYGNLELPFDPAASDIVNIRARTIKPDGSSVNFDGKIYEKYVTRGGFRVLAKAFALPEVQTGCIIEYSFTIVFGRFLYDSHWILNTDLFTRHAQFSLVPYRFSDTPMSLRRTLHDVPFGNEPTTGPDGVVRMEIRNIPAFRAEDYMPPENELKARVDFTYDLGFHDPDPDKFWDGVRKRRYDDLESFMKKKKAVERAAASMTIASDPPEAKLRKIYAHVQQLRNTSYQFERTAKEEKRFKEKAAENIDDVWKHGYGNGTELTWLFLALARASGVEVYGCWVSNRSEYFFNSKLNASEDLRNNVVLAKINGKEVYLDPGVPFVPFGVLPWSETFSAGIRLDAQGGAWIRTPMPNSDESRIQTKGELKLLETGSLQGNVKLTLTGLEATYHRIALLNEDETTRKDYLQELLKQRIPIPSEVELATQPDWNSSENPLSAEFVVRIPNFAALVGHRILLPPGIFGAGEKRIFESTDRVHPIYFAYPYSKEDDFTIVLPSGLQIASVPKDRSHAANGFKFDMKIKEDEKNRSVHITRQLRVDAFLLEASQYSGVRRFFQLVRSADEDLVVLETVAPPEAK